jgi:cell division control protein 6
MSSSLIPNTPTAEISQLRLNTPPPTPPTVLAPMHVRVKALLRSTSNGAGDMPGRESESQTIRQFITSFLDDASGRAEDVSALYISGTPGTGKTALVHSVLGSLDLKSKDVRPVVINCMALNNLDSLRDRLVEEFGSKAVKAKKFKSKRTMETIFSEMQTKW